MKTDFKAITHLRPDSKGRISLGKLAEGISSYEVRVDQTGRILLEPFVEIPAREQWLFQNRGAIESVRRGLGESAAGQTVSLGSFAEYTTDDSEHE
jgi:hypothetical protein